MLNKDICKICINEANDHWRGKWREKDNDRWKRKTVWCLYVSEISIYQKPPKRCKYYTEHIVSE